MHKCPILIMLAFTKKIERGSTLHLLKVISVRLPTSDPPWCKLALYTFSFEQCYYFKV